MQFVMNSITFLWIIRDESEIDPNVRWIDRVTYDGTWGNNFFNFFKKVNPKLTSDLKKPFKLNGLQRMDDTPIHHAIREIFVNMIIHADYLSEGILKRRKTSNSFIFTNSGTLKLPKKEIYKGENSKPRNPRIQTMLRLVGYGDNVGSGFPAIVAAWTNEKWQIPELQEETLLNQVTLQLVMKNNTRQNPTPMEMPSFLREIVEQSKYGLKTSIT